MPIYPSVAPEFEPLTIALDKARRLCRHTVSLPIAAAEALVQTTLDGATPSAISHHYIDATDDQLYTPPEAARFLGLHVDTLANWRCSGRIVIPHIKVWQKCPLSKVSAVASCHNGRRLPRKEEGQSMNAAPIYYQCCGRSFGPTTSFVQQLQCVLAANPDLCAAGWNFKAYSPDSFQRERQKTAEDDFPLQAWAARHYLLCPRVKRPTGRDGSYGMKHAAERHAGENGSCQYICNGALIAAALVLGFGVKRIRGTLNCTFTRRLNYE